MSVYNTEPVKKNTQNNQSKPVNRIQPGLNTPSANQSKGMTVSFQTTADLNQKYEGKLFDPDKGKFKTVADYHTQTNAGLAGVGYNIMLSANFGSAGAIAAGKVLGIGLGTTSLVLGEDYGVAKAATITSVGFALKGSNFGYEAVRKKISEPLQRYIGNATIQQRIGQNAVHVWEQTGQWLYEEVYHKIPMINPLGVIPGHHVGFSAVPLQWVESYVTKDMAKSAYGAVFGKKPYQPWQTGQSSIDRLYLENSTFSLSSPSGNSVSNYIKPASVDFNATIRSIRPPETPSDAGASTYRVKTRKPPKEEKSEEELLVKFLTDFNAAAPKNKWERRWKEIIYPEVYADYNKAIGQIGKLALKKATGNWFTNLGQWFQNAMFGDVEKAIKNIITGTEGTSKLWNGIDYTDEMIEKLAKFKTDLENAGGKFIINSDGSYHFQYPTEEQDKIYTEKLRTKFKYSTTAAGMLAGADKEDPVDIAKTQNNIPLIRNMNKIANKNQEDLSLRQFIKNTYNVDVFKKRLGSNLENIQKLTGRTKAQVIDAFYAQYPQYQTEDYKVEKQLNKLPETWQKKQFLGKYNNYHGLNRKGRSQFTYDPRTGLRRIITN
jgi:hypothetical protein